MSLIPEISEFKVSSVLNGDRKMYGKKFLFDGNDETCWNSDQGAPQWIEIKFRNTKTVEKIVVQFQGGFAAKEMKLEVLSLPDDSSDCTEKSVETFYPLDINQTQQFSLAKPVSAPGIKIVLPSSYDFYGRIIIYNLDIFGS